MMKNRVAIYYGAGLVIILTLSWWLRTEIVAAHPFDYDEGHWLMFGALVNAGYPAYTTTFVGIPPLALLVIQLGERLFGATLAVRYPMMGFSLIGIAGLFWLVQSPKSWLGLLSGALAAIFLSFNTAYFQDSASIMAEVPSVAMAILSLALAYQYYVARKLFWLFLSGLTFALSLALKIFLIFLPVLIVSLILLSALNNKNKTKSATIQQVVIAVSIWSGGFLIPPLIFAVIYNPWSMYQQVFVFRLALRQVWSERITLLDNLNTVGQMWLSLSPLLAGALLGIISGWQKRRLQVGLWLGWLTFSTFLLVWQIPLRDRYVVMLVPSLAGLSGIGVVGGLAWLSQKLRHTFPGKLNRVVTTLLMVGVISWALVNPVKLAALPSSPDTFPSLNLDAVRYVWQNTLPGDCIITDDQRFAFAVERLVPAFLSETSWARIITGWLTVDDIANELLIHHCPVVVNADRRFQHQLPELDARLQELYFLKIAFIDEVIIYTGNKQLNRQPQLLIEAELDSSIILNGIDLEPSPPWLSGQEVRLAAYWTAYVPPKKAYKIFVQLINEQGEIVANADHFPFPAPGGDYTIFPFTDYQNYFAEDIAKYPTLGMLPTIGRTVREVTPLILPDDLPPGNYSLCMGMYDPDNQTRLVVERESLQSDAVLLTDILIVTGGYP